MESCKLFDMHSGSQALLHYTSVLLIFVQSLEHAKALGIVSAVGCAVSIVCLIVTLVIHAFVWRLVNIVRIPGKC